MGRIWFLSIDRTAENFNHGRAHHALASIEGDRLAVCHWCFVRSLFLLAMAFLQVMPGHASDILVNDMLCSSYSCPTGSIQRWNASDVFCAYGACNGNDTSTCCVQGQFYSHRWRVVAASNVSDIWEVARLRFLLADDCNNASEVDTIPGLHSSYSRWPNGEAFSHRHGHGHVAARAFAADVAPTPRKPSPERSSWNSGGPCAVGACYIGFTWSAITDRHPLGKCRARSNSGCSTSSYIRQAGKLRIGCAEVEQSLTSGQFAETLRLEFLDTSAVDPYVWRTAAILDGATGGLAQIQMMETGPL